MADPASLLGLQSVTERIQEDAFREDPVARMAMEEALRERMTAQQQQVQQATGLTGAAQVQTADRMTDRQFKAKALAVFGAPRPRADRARS